MEHYIYYAKGQPPKGPDEGRAAVLYIHGKGGNAGEAAHYRALFEGWDVFGMEYRAETPWQAVEEFPALFDTLCGAYRSVTVVANSIGAYFCMNALGGKKIEKAFFVSPIVDMEQLILTMLGWAGTTEEALREQKVIPTDFGETLSYEYLCYVRQHPPLWRVPTEILYGERDHLTARPTVTAFAERVGAGLCVMPEGEHWFHTEEQMQFLDTWLGQRR